MKIQIQKGSKNTQSSSDPNTVQVQISSKAIKWAIVILITLILIGGVAIQQISY